MQPWYHEPVVVFDVETTGLSHADGDRIVEIGFARFERGRLLHRWGTLVNPGRPIPKSASDIHGITDEDVANAPKFYECIQEIENISEGAQPAAYSAQFDRGFLYGELTDVDYQGGSLIFHEAFPWVDPLVWARQIRGPGRNKLTACCEDYGIDLENAHRATDDAVAAGRLLFALVEHIKEYNLTDLLAAQQKYQEQQDAERKAWLKTRNRR